jgi:hypothetical protein
MTVNDRAIMEALITAITVIERQPQPTTLAVRDELRRMKVALRDHFLAQKIPDPDNNLFVAGAKYQATYLVDRIANVNGVSVPILADAAVGDINAKYQ